MIFTVQRPDSQNNDIQFEHLDYEYHNIDLLMERLKNIGLISADEITNKADVLENNQCPENDKFVVRRESDWAMYFLMLFLLLMLFKAFSAPFLSRDFVSAVFMFIFISTLLQRALGKIIYYNNIIEYGFIFKKKFKTQDISHVKFIPHINLFGKAKIFLKDEKSTFTVYKDSKNFDRFIETLRREGVIFK